jgi:hypothetical protein
MPSDAATTREIDMSARNIFVILGGLPAARTAAARIKIPQKVKQLILNKFVVQYRIAHKI